MALVDYALVSLDDAKEVLSITGDAEDDKIINLINRATDIIETYCNGRRFASTTHTNEIYDGTGDYYLPLEHYPVTTLTSVERRTGDFDTPAWEALESAFYDLDDDGERGPGMVYHSGGFMEGARNYRITYTAGYTTIPNDLQQACFKLIAFLYTQTKATGMKSETLGEYSYTKADNESTLKELGLDEVLDAYRTPVVANIR